MKKTQWNNKQAMAKVKHSDAADLPTYKIYLATFDHIYIYVCVYIWSKLATCPQSKQGYIF